VGRARVARIVHNDPNTLMPGMAVEDTAQQLSIRWNVIPRVVRAVDDEFAPSHTCWNNARRESGDSGRLPVVKNRTAWNCRRTSAVSAPRSSELCRNVTAEAPDSRPRSVSTCSTCASRSGAPRRMTSCSSPAECVKRRGAAAEASGWSPPWPRRGHQADDHENMGLLIKDSPLASPGRSTRPVPV
jgi:hypothetical protein